MIFLNREHFKATGKTICWKYQDKSMIINNQRSRLWAYPYDFREPSESTLHDSGCGIFSIAHAVGWMHGFNVNIEDLADFSCAHHGRGDDGTDRPALLGEMMNSGLAGQFGFVYNMDGLRNDLEALWKHITQKEGVAICNLRVGHIVTLVEARVKNGCRQVLVIDSNSESNDARITDSIYECDANSVIIDDKLNKNQVLVCREIRYAVYWALLDIVRDFNLLHRIK